MSAFVVGLPKHVASWTAFPVQSVLADHFILVLAVYLVVFGQVALEAELLLAF